MRFSRLWAGVALALTTLVAAGCGDDKPAGRAAAPQPAKTTAAPGGRIVYAAETDGAPTQLVSIHPDGTGKVQVTHLAEGEAVNPDWAIDGSKLTYEASTSDDHAGVYIASADGSGERDLTPKGFQGQPSFSPDGRRIVFERHLGPGNNGVYIMDADGTHLRRLTHNPFPQKDSCGCDTDPNFSPDGKTITFLRIKRDESLQALFAMNADGTNVRRLTPYSWDVANKHAWAPDGKRILLTFNGNPAPGESSNIVTIRPDGTDMKRLTHLTGGHSAYGGSYSPDGSRIVFRLEHDEKYRLVTSDVDGGRIRTVFSSATVRPRNIDWGR
jgi:TolB protein